MSTILNQFSFLIAMLVMLGGVAFFLYRRGFKRHDGLILGGLVVLMGVVWLVVRPTSPRFTSAEQVRSQIGAGKPVLLEFQSPY